MAKLNPVFSGIRVDEGIETAATVKGVSMKTVLLLGITVLSAFFSLTIGAELIYGNMGFYVAVLLGTIFSGVIGQTSPNAAKICSFIYAACEGALLGLVSFMFDAYISGIVLTAILITFTIFGVMLFLYTTNIIKVTGRMMKVMTSIAISIFIVSVVITITSLINPSNVLIVALYHNPSLMLIVSLFILIYGALMLAIDFEQVRIIVSNGFDKRYEWMAALGLMVTIVWIYVQVLRILSILLRNRK